MQKGPLLLSGAKQGIVIGEKTHLRRLGVILGAFLVLFGFIGAANILFGFFSARNGSAAYNPSPALQAPRNRGADDASSPLTPGALVIDKLGVKTNIEHVGVNNAGNMAVPSSYGTVSWYKEGTSPGAVGNAVIAGHLDNSLGLPGIFENLNRLGIGDKVSVVGEDGHRLTFVVKEMAVYTLSEAPAEMIFGGDGSSRNLVLITCNGAWDGNAKSYEKRLVVTAELQG